MGHSMEYLIPLRPGATSVRQPSCRDKQTGVGVVGQHGHRINTRVLLVSPSPFVFLNCFPRDHPPAKSTLTTFHASALVCSPLQHTKTLRHRPPPDPGLSAPPSPPQRQACLLAHALRASSPRETGFKLRASSLTLPLRIFGPKHVASSSQEWDT